MSEVVLNAEVRKETGKKANRLRYQEKIPGVYYAHGEGNINITATPVGVKDGGTLQFVMHKVRVSCLPKFIPEHIQIEVTELKMNESVHVSDIKLENARIIDNAAGTIVAVVPPTIVKEETPVAAVKGAEAAGPAGPEGK